MLTQPQPSHSQEQPQQQAHVSLLLNTSRRLDNMNNQSNQDIIKDRKAGMKINAIALKYGMDKMDVRDILLTANKPKKIRKKSY